MIYNFIAGYIGILAGDLIFDYFKNKIDFKAIYYGTAGYWLAVLMWAINGQ